MSKEFAVRGVVNHGKDEYVCKDGKTHIQSAEAFFAILKRMGSFHSISEQHLQRYIDEFAFRWTMGVEDFERAAAILKGAEGKRLMYRPRPNSWTRGVNDRISSHCGGEPIV